MPLPPLLTSPTPIPPTVTPRLRRCPARHHAYVDAVAATQTRARTRRPHKQHTHATATVALTALPPAHLLNRNGDTHVHTHLDAIPNVDFLADPDAHADTDAIPDLVADAHLHPDADAVPAAALHAHAHPCAQVRGRSRAI